MSLKMILQPAILYIDDEQANLDTFKRAFKSDFLVKTCLSGEEALELLRTEDFPIVVADQRMPGMSGIELCEKLLSIKPEAVRIILTAYSETELLLDAIHRGHVHDYIVKPWRKSELKPILNQAYEDYKRRALKLRELELHATRTKQLKEEIKQKYNIDLMVGAKSGLRRIMEDIGKVAPTDATIMITGETGTGKELLARAIHGMSGRSDGPFVPVHCAALTKTLLESELFGHEKGSFTGADHMHMGRFEVANGGTLFLDEVSEIPEEVQVKLLRVLQEREILRVGGTRSISVDVRLIAATNRDLKRWVQEGRFREDLYYRLNVVPVLLPPLRERKEDIPQLANNFLRKHALQEGRDLRLVQEAIDLLQRYDWPGNIRELENIIERAAILCPGPDVEPEDLNLNIDQMLQTERVNLDRISSAVEKTESLRETIQRQEVQTLMDALKRAEGNISETARILGLARSTLFHRLKKHKLI